MSPDATLAAGPAEAPGAVPTPLTGTRTGVLAVLCVAVAAYSVLQSFVVPALGTLQRRLDASATGTAWILTTYLLSASALAPLAGRLGDLYGKKRVLTWSLLLLAGGSGISALASSLPMMLAGRLVQGAGGAVFPLAAAIIRDLLPASRRAGAIALITGVWSVGGALGTVVAGPVVDLLSYHWLFWLPMGVALGAAVAASLLLPEATTDPSAQVPVLSAAWFATWLTLLLLAVTALADRSAGVAAVLAAAGVLLAATWARREVRVAQPMVNLRAAWEPAVRAVSGATLLLGFGMFGVWMLVPLLIQQDPRTGVGLGAPAAAVGLYLLPSAVGTLAVTPLVSRLTPTRGIVLGTATAAAAYASLALAHGSPLAIALAILLEGAGIGLAFSAVAIAAVELAPPAESGVASGVNTIMRTVGGTVGSTAAGSLLALFTTRGGAPTEPGYVIAFATFSLALGLAAAISARSRVPGLRGR